MRIFWQESMSLGVAALDDDHRRLVALLDGVCVALQGRNLPAAGDAITEFIEAMALHFASEERLIDQFGGDHDDHHRAGHADTARLVDRLRGAIIDAGDHGLALALAGELITLWITRLFHHDNELVARLKRPRRASKPETSEVQGNEPPSARARTS
jgi:hemerythrin